MSNNTLLAKVVSGLTGLLTGLTTAYLTLTISYFNNMQWSFVLVIVSTLAMTVGALSAVVLFTRQRVRLTFSLVFIAVLMPAFFHFGFIGALAGVSFLAGLTSTLVPYKLAQQSMAELRGRLLSWLPIFINLGIVLGFVAHLLFIHYLCWFEYMLLLAVLVFLIILDRYLCYYFVAIAPNDTKSLLRFDWGHFFSAKRSIALRSFQQLSGINFIIVFSHIIFNADLNQNSISKVMLGFLSFGLFIEFVSSRLVDRVGRIVVLKNGILVMLLALSAFWILTQFASYAHSELMLVAVTLVLFLFRLGYSIGPGPVVWVLCSEYALAEQSMLQTASSLIINWWVNMVLMLSCLMLVTKINLGMAFILLILLNVFFMLMHSAYLRPKICPKLT